MESNLGFLDFFLPFIQSDSWIKDLTRPSYQKVNDVFLKNSFCLRCLEDEQDCFLSKKEAKMERVGTM